jgi:predicted alpha/beta hydrolase family esterase
MGVRFVNAGPCRHINVAAGVGPWPAEQKILDELVREARNRQAIKNAADAQ